MFYSTCYNMSREHPAANKSFQEPNSTGRVIADETTCLYQGSIFTSGEEGGLATYSNLGPIIMLVPCWYPCGNPSRRDYAEMTNNLSPSAPRLSLYGRPPPPPGRQK